MGAKRKGEREVESEEEREEHREMKVGREDAGRGERGKRDKKGEPK